MIPGRTRKQLKFRLKATLLGEWEWVVQPGIELGRKWDRGRESASAISAHRLTELERGNGGGELPQTATVDRAQNM